VPILGVTMLQTLRLNVVLPPSRSASCDALLLFADANGDPVGRSLTVSLSAGQAAFLDLAGSTLVRGLGQRAEVRAIVSPIDDAGASADGCLATAEVYDAATGADRVLAVGVPAVQLPPNPIIGMVGLGLFQTARLNVLAVPPNPCLGDLGFADSAGNPVGASQRVSLNSGQAAFLDLNGNTLVRRLGQRAEVRPVFTPAGGTCQVSAQVYEQVTGSTLVQTNPGPPTTE
jgi:hypothetical protein